MSGTVGGADAFGLPPMVATGDPAVIPIGQKGPMSPEEAALSPGRRAFLRKKQLQDAMLKSQVRVAAQQVSADVDPLLEGLPPPPPDVPAHVKRMYPSITPEQYANVLRQRTAEGLPAEPPPLTELPVDLNEVSAGIEQTAIKVGEAARADKAAAEAAAIAKEEQQRGAPPADPRLKARPADPQAALAALLGGSGPQAIGGQTRAAPALGGGRELITGGFGKRKTAVRERADIQLEQAKSVLDSQTELHRESRRRHLELTAASEFARDQIARHNNVIGRLEQAIQEKKINPNRLFSARAITQIGNTIGNIFGTLAAARLGVAGNTFAPTAKQNVARINQIIERDIASQQQEIDTLKGAVGARQNAISMVREDFDSVVQQGAAASILLREVVKNKLIADGAKHRTPGIEADVKEMTGLLDIEDGIQREKIAESDRSAAAQKAAGAVASEKSRLDEIAKRLEITKKFNEVMGIQFDTPNIRQIEGTSATPGDRTGSQKIFDAYNAFVPQIDKLLVLIPQLSTTEKILPARLDAMKAVANSIMADLFSQYKGEALANFGAALTESEKKILTQILPLDASQLSVSIIVQLKQVRDSIHDRLTGKMRVRNYELVPPKTKPRAETQQGE